MQKGTSLPILLPISHNSLIEVLIFKCFTRANKTEAASADPPPRPEPTGIILWIWIFLREKKY